MALPAGGGMMGWRWAGLGWRLILRCRATDSSPPQLVQMACNMLPRRRACPRLLLMTRGGRRRALGSGLGALLTLAACTVASPSIAPSTSGSAAPSESPSAGGLPATGQVVATEPLVLRSAPGTGADSTVLPVGLSPGMRFAILEGPVEASDYRWYRVLVGEISGWAAAGSREGEPWLAAVRNGGISFGGQPAGEAVPQLFRVDPDGTDLRQLTHLTDADIALDAPLRDAAGGQVRPVLTCGFGVGGQWSPSGARIALSVGGCETVILTVAADGDSVVRIADGRGPAWSNDGAQLAFELNIPYLPCGRDCGGPDIGPWDIQVAPATGGAISVVSQGAPWEASSGPIWSPSSRELAFTCGPIDGTSSVCMVNSDGSHRHIVAATSLVTGSTDDALLVARSLFPGGARLLSWAPDGTWLVVRRTTAANVNELWLVRADGSDERILPGVGDAFPAAWSPDGQQIGLTFIEVTSGAQTTILISTDGSSSRELAADSRFEAWAPDGQSILVSSVAPTGAATLSVIDVESGTIRPIVDLPSELIGTSSGFAWQPFLEYSLN